MTLKPLDNPISPYPHQAGWKGTDTSREAADKVSGSAAVKRSIILKHFRDNYPQNYTAPEVQDILGGTLNGIRSRISELKASGHLEEATITNDKGKTVKIRRKDNFTKMNVQALVFAVPKPVPAPKPYVKPVQQALGL